MQFQVGAYLEASVTDGDVPSNDKDVSFETNVIWQWRRSPSMTATGTAISNATDPVYTVTAEDVGQYLRVEATYILSGQTETVSLPSSYPVLAEAGADVAAPKFAQVNIDRKVNEGDKGLAVGSPVTATGGHGKLNYLLAGTDSDRFEIDQNTGQIMTSADLDYEAGAGTDDNCGAMNSCEVEVTATDAAGVDSSTAATVTITLVNADDKPMFDAGDKTVSVEERTKDLGVAAYEATDPEGDRINLSLRGDDGRLFEIDDNGFLSFKTAPDYEDPKDRGRDNVYNVTVRAIAFGSRLYADQPVKVTVTDDDEAPEISGKDSFMYAENGTGPVETFMAEDPEGGAVTWSLVDPNNIPTDIPTDVTVDDTTAADEGHFDIGAKTGVLTFDIGGDDDTPDDSDPPDFERPRGTGPVDDNNSNTYRVVLVASDVATGEKTEVFNVYKKVTVTVTEEKEDGKVTFTTTGNLVQFQVGTSITASVTDGDESVLSEIPAGVAPTWRWHRLPSKNARHTTTTEIPDAESGDAAAYTALIGDVGKYLRAVATYKVTSATTTDDTEQTAFLTSDHSVLAVDANVGAPEFAQESINREVKEGDKGMAAGAPVTATGGHGKLSYALDGDDSNRFEIDRKTGQITTTTALDYEDAAVTDDNCIATNSCEVEVTATDAAAGPTDPVATVTIKIVDVNEKPKFTDKAVMKWEVRENTAEVSTGNAYAASDPEERGITLSLKSGADSGLFRLTASDDLSFRAKPNYETRRTGTGTTCTT